MFMLADGWLGRRWCLGVKCLVGFGVVRLPCVNVA